MNQENHYNYEPSGNSTNPYDPQIESENRSNFAENEGSEQSADLNPGNTVPQTNDDTQLPNADFNPSATNPGDYQTPIAGQPLQQPTTSDYATEAYLRQFENPNSGPSNKPTSGLSIAGLILAFVAPLVGLVISIIALFKIKQNKENGKGLAIAGIVVGSILSLLWTVVGIILGLAMIGYMTEQNSYSSSDYEGSLYSNSDYETITGAELPYLRDPASSSDEFVIAGQEVSPSYCEALPTFLAEFSTDLDATSKSDLANDLWFETPFDTESEWLLAEIYRTYGFEANYNLTEADVDAFYLENVKPALDKDLAQCQAEGL